MLVVWYSFFAADFGACGNKVDATTDLCQHSFGWRLRNCQSYARNYCDRGLTTGRNNRGEQEEEEKEAISEFDRVLIWGI